MNWAIVLAAGSGTRMGVPIPKQFLDLAGRPILAWALEAFERATSVDRVVLAVPEGREEFCRTRFGPGAGFSKVTAVTAGGATRQDSVRRGLEVVPQGVAVIAVHDGARAFVRAEDIDAVILAAQKFGAAAPGTPVRDTVKRVSVDHVLETVDRSELWCVQTPQAFRSGVLRRAHAAAGDFLGTDDACLVERIGEPVVIVPGRADNVKVTTPEDLSSGYSILERQGCVGFRIGQGYDVHRFATGRPLILGGVAIPFEKGLLGHSDADVLAHAVMDAVLGALGAGDIGRHFPDTDPAYKGISSLALLERVAQRVKESGGRVINVDATVMAQQPKLAPHIPLMCGKMAGALQLPAGCVNVKATTTEGLGFVGREEGMAAQAVALVQVGP